MLKMTIYTDGKFNLRRTIEYRLPYYREGIKNYLVQRLGLAVAADGNADHPDARSFE